jgi:hypothetical protein
LTERAKIALSEHQRAVIDVNGAVRAVDGVPILESVEVQRSEFEVMIRQTVVDALALCQQAIVSAARAGVPLSSIDDVVMTGGSSRIPLVGALLAQQVKRTVRFLDTDSVAIGAAIFMTREYGRLALQERAREALAAVDRTGSLADAGDYAAAIVRLKTEHERASQALAELRRSADTQRLLQEAIEVITAGIGRITKAQESFAEDPRDILRQFDHGLEQLDQASRLRSHISDGAFQALSRSDRDVDMAAVREWAHSNYEHARKIGARMLVRSAIQRANDVFAGLGTGRTSQRAVQTLQESDAALHDATHLDPTVDVVPSRREIHRVLDMLQAAAAVEELAASPRTGLVRVPAPASRVSDVPGGRVDRVHFSVTAPASVAPLDAFVVTVWAHLDAQRDAVVARARESVAPGEAIVIQTKGPSRISRGTVLSITLHVEGLIIERRDDTILWDGDIGNATFPVSVPADAVEGPRRGTASCLVDGLEIARLDFVLRVGGRQSDVEALAVREARHRTAFASYARWDKAEVGARIQGMRKAVPDLDIFWDVLSLRAGQKWESELRKVVPSRDVFYLFWSKAASRSTWVEREWRCALEARGLDYIDPVPLVSPDRVPPPPELAPLHFDDWMLAFARSQHFHDHAGRRRFSVRSMWNGIRVWFPMRE